MNTSVIGILTLLVAGCASQPPTKPTALDPSNPLAAEAPAPTLTPLVDANAERAAPAADDEATAPMEMPMSHENEKHAGTEKPAVTYTCPMHPEISMPKPGNCPKCGMNLVPRKPTAEPGEQAAEAPMAGRTHGHDKAPSAEKKAVSYMCSMHPEVTSPKPGKCPKCGMKLIPRKPSEPK